MDLKNLYYRAAFRIHQARAAAYLGVMGLYLGSNSAYAATVSDVISGWQEAAQAGVSFLVWVFLMLGVAAVGWGCKLLWDKSNDRADVKTSHILWSLLGGAFMCALWFVVEVLVTTSGGDSSNIGGSQTFGIGG